MHGLLHVFTYKQNSNHSCARLLSLLLPCLQEWAAHKSRNAAAAHPNATPGTDVANAANTSRLAATAAAVDDDSPAGAAKQRTADRAAFGAAVAASVGHGSHNVTGHSSAATTATNPGPSGTILPAKRTAEAPTGAAGTAPAPKKTAGHGQALGSAAGTAGASSSGLGGTAHQAPAAGIASAPAPAAAAAAAGHGNAGQGC
jgi:hypothetical protein